MRPRSAIAGPPWSVLPRTPPPGPGAALRDAAVVGGPRERLAHPFFALWCRGVHAPVSRVLEPGPGDDGLPRMEAVELRASDPIVELRLHDAGVPFETSVEAFDAVDGGLAPTSATLFLWRLHNPSAHGVELTLAYSQPNPVGELNRWVDAGDARGIALSGADGGGLAVATPWRAITFLERWEAGLRGFWDDFAADGRLPNRAGGTPDRTGGPAVGTLGLVGYVDSGQTIELPFVLAWPEADAWAVAADACRRIEELTGRARLLRDERLAATGPVECAYETDLRRRDPAAGDRRRRDRSAPEPAPPTVGRLRFTLPNAAAAGRGVWAAGGAWGRVEIVGPRAALAILEGEIAVGAIEVGGHVYDLDPPTRLEAGTRVEVEPDE